MKRGIVFIVYMYTVILFYIILEAILTLFFLGFTGIIGCGNKNSTDTSESIGAETAPSNETDEDTGFTDTGDLVDIADTSATDSGEEELDEIPCSPDVSGIGLPLVSNPPFSVTVQEGVPYLSDLENQNILFYPDGALSFLHSEGLWEVFLPVGNKTMTLSGDSPESLTLQNTTPILAPTGQITDPFEGYVGANTVLECNDERIAFFHAEYHQIGVPPMPNAPPPYHATMGRATAPLGTTSFTYDEPSWFLTSSQTANYTSTKLAYGAGGGSIFDGGDFYFLYYYDWDGDQGVHVARACKDTCGEHLTWRKWMGSSFDSEAFSTDFLSPSGASSVIVPATATGFDAFNVVSYNTYLDSYLMISATEEGIGLRNSPNGIDWGERVPVLEHVSSVDATMRILYPSAFDSQTWSRNQTGRNLKIVYGLEMNSSGGLAPHRAWIADVELTTAEDQSINTAHLKELNRYVNADMTDHWTTTMPVSSEYTLEAPLGKIAANSIPDTMPVFDCDLNGNHLASLYSSCENGISGGVMGYIWESGGNNRIPIYRCFTSNSVGTDHFLSVDTQCEGQQVEGILGYVSP